MTRIRIMCDQTDGTTIKLGTIQSDETGDTLYSAHPSLTQDMYRAPSPSPYCAGSAISNNSAKSPTNKTRTTHEH